MNERRVGHRTSGVGAAGAQEPLPRAAPGALLRFAQGHEATLERAPLQRGAARQRLGDPCQSGHRGQHALCRECGGIKMGGGGDWDPKVGAPKMADKISPVTNFVVAHDGHFGRGGGGVVAPLLLRRTAIRILPWGWGWGGGGGRGHRTSTARSKPPKQSAPSFPASVGAPFAVVGQDCAHGCRLQIPPRSMLPHRSRSGAGGGGGAIKAHKAGAGGGGGGGWHKGSVTTSGCAYALNFRRKLAAMFVHRRWGRVCLVHDSHPAAHNCCLGPSASLPRQRRQYFTFRYSHDSEDVEGPHSVIGMAVKFGGSSKSAGPGAERGAGRFPVKRGGLGGWVGGSAPPPHPTPPVGVPSFWRC